jgi:hypothetical protein
MVTEDRQIAPEKGQQIAAVDQELNEVRYAKAMVGIGV